MKKLTTPLIVLALAFSATLTACKHAPGEAKADPLSLADYPQVAALEELRGKLKLSEAPVVSYSDAGPMTVTVAVRVASNKEYPAQYRFYFYDHAGQPLNADPAWQHLVLPARAKVYLTGTALEADAADWAVEVRPARHPK